MTARAPLPLLIGPTGSGKSAVAFELSRHRGVEILSVDSMKIYKRLNIGVAKPSHAESAAVCFHLIDWKEPWEHCSVAEWLAEAERVAASAQVRGAALLAEGGTAMYLKALREGLFPGPGRDADLRAALEAEAKAHGVATLFERLKKVDALAAGKILPNDVRRMVRALEVHALTGRPISEQQVQWGTLRKDWSIPTVGLLLDRQELYRRIDKRVERMMAAGWLDECRALRALDREHALSKEAQQAIGYRTLFAHLEGTLTLDEARQRIQFDTHHFARKQLLWFRKFAGVKWVEVKQDEEPDRLALRVAETLETWRTTPEE